MQAQGGTRLSGLAGILLVSSLVLQGCSGASPADGGLTGRWTGTWIVTDQEPALIFEVTLVLIQDRQGNLQGTALLRDTRSNTASALPLLGRISQETVSLTLGNITPLPVIWEGSVAGGSTMNGTSISAQADYPAGGTWVLERVIED